MQNYLVYDIEIIKAIPQKDEPRIPGIDYCSGWDDHENMGISVIGAYLSNPSGMFSKMAFISKGDKESLSIQDFESLTELMIGIGDIQDFARVAAESDAVISFNGINFDDRVCAANNIPVRTTYDLLCESFLASDQPPFYKKGVTRSGYGLGSISEANLGRGKTGHGAEAPVLWQKGKKLEVIEYCLDDVMLTKELFDMRRSLIDPNDGAPMICSANPWASEGYYWERGDR